MSEHWTLGILGLYTVIYLIVFLIQKSQIDKQKDVISSMKSFMDVFKVDEVEKFVKLKENRMLMQFEDEIKKGGYLQDLIENTVTDKLEPIKKNYIEQMGEQHLEMTAVIVEFMKAVKQEDRERFIIEQLNSCKHIFIPMLDEIEKNRS